MKRTAQRLHLNSAPLRQLGDPGFLKGTGRRTPVFLALVAVLLAWPAAAQAPANMETWQVKFFCGFTDGRVPKLNDPTPLPAPYRAVEPGNYATVINVQQINNVNRNANIFASAFVAGHPGAALDLGTIPPYEVRSVDCRDITAALGTRWGFPNDGRYVEGYVVLSRYTDATDINVLSVEVNAGYSYAIQKADNTGTGLGSSFQVLRIQSKPMFQPE